MSGKGNRGFADLVAGEGGQAAAKTRLPPRTGLLAGRENRLAELVSGHAVTRIHELVDPARCLIWPTHNRDYAALDESNCADLIESIRAQGRQEVPAIVRRIRGGEADFEVICGARRHWTVSWLRAHGMPDLRFMIEPRELTDEEAFRISDLENRSRRDLSDYERAIDYARAMDRYYDNSQQRMAERLQVTTSWLSRYLELARLPAFVLEAFGSTAAIGISHAAKLAPLLRAPFTRGILEQAAAVVSAEQARRRSLGMVSLTPPQVMTQLLTRPTSKAKPVRQAVVTDERNRTLASGERTGSGMVTMKLTPVAQRTRETALDVVKELLEKLS
jgi:ParB family chromosome partitioning protein